MLIPDHLTQDCALRAGRGPALKVTHQSYTPKCQVPSEGRCCVSPNSHGLRKVCLEMATQIATKHPSSLDTRAQRGRIWPQRERGVEQGQPPQYTHKSWVQFAGLSIRWPSFKSLKSSSTGIPGYGDPPKVKISHSSTPKDQLETKERSLKFNEVFFPSPPISHPPCLALFLRSHA